MKLIGLEKAKEGKFLTYYVAKYLNLEGNIKCYEFFSRNKNLTVENFGEIVPAGIGVIPISMDDKKILVSKEFRMSCNKWVFQFPTGLIDEGETPAEAAKRELFEETGVNLETVDVVLPPSYASAPTSDEAMVIIVGHASGEIRASDNVNEEILAKWYTKEEIKELLYNGEMMSVRTQIFLWKWISE